MKYVVAKSRKDNFGDDLNAWLWPELFGNKPGNDDTYFLGIGSILLGNSPLLAKMDNARKIVFGSGVRPSESYIPYQPDSKTDIRFLRGPLSAAMLLNKYEYISDAAYAIRQLKDFESLKNTTKKYRISLMPYFLSADLYNWQAICKELGYHYISPLSEHGVEFTLKEIAASSCLITEAMHGAIAADLLRVPWHRFVLSTPHMEGTMVSQFKWSDWQQSIAVNEQEVSFIPFYKKTRVHNWIKRASFDKISTEFLFKQQVRKKIIAGLATEKKYCLSSDVLLQEIDERIARKISDVKRDYF